MHVFPVITQYFPSNGDIQDTILFRKSHTITLIDKVIGFQKLRIFRIIAKKATRFIGMFCREISYTPFALLFLETQQITIR